LKAIRSTSYKAPIKDVKFIFDDVLKVHEHFPEHASPDVVDMIIGEVAKFSENILHPIHKIGDQGCKFDGNDVKTPPGWKEAYAQYVEGGWPTLTAPTQFGGQAFPNTLDTVKSEFCATANWTWFMYPMLSHGAVECLLAHADAKTKEIFLPNLITGKWTGTMCLTEGNAGSDLGQVKTKAEPLGDGTYKITGNKIFISCGECDFSENIIHLVLARLPDAPAGTKGISLFLVPKFLTKPDGSLDDKKNALCAGIEHKMGIKGSATAVMAFEGSTGWLIGKPNDGMRQMFSFMNTARLIVGVQGLGHGEFAFQQSVPYAKERLAGRAPTGAKFPDKVADPIIVHPDIRRMLLKMKAFTEGARCLVYHTSLLEDKVKNAKDEKEKHRFEEELGLLTPIVKAFLSEIGLEIANDGIQVYGGHGYIAEWGLEQNVRDARISTLYEGTTGIQSLDLLGRKIIMGGGKSLVAFAKDIFEFTNKHVSNPALLPHVTELNRVVAEWLNISTEVIQRAKKDPNSIGSSSYDYLFYSGYVVLAYMWLRMEAVAVAKLAEKSGDPEFLKAKIQTSQFYFNRFLPRTRTLAQTILATPQDLMQINENNFTFLE